MWHGREIWRIGLDQQPSERHVAGNGAQLLGCLEGQDAGERNEKAHLDAELGQPTAGRETMQNGTEGPRPHFLGENGLHVRIRIARMNDERQPRFARGGDMGAKPTRLCITRGLVVEIIQPRLANADAARMGREPHQFFGGNAIFFAGLMRMCANRAPYFRM